VTRRDIARKNASHDGGTTPPWWGEAVTRISGYSYKRLLVYYTGGRLLV